LFDGLGKFHKSTTTLDFVVSKSFFYLDVCPYFLQIDIKYYARCI
jgi:hypothetical protein